MLSDKIIIVTGGSGLLGKAIIKSIETKGGIAINADINTETDLSKFAFKLDITSLDSIKECLNSVYSHFGKIDGLVNNAYPRTSDWGAKFEDIKYESWKTNIEMQLDSVFAMSQKCLSIMQEQKFGNIVNITSIYGVVGNDFTIYENTNGMTSPAAYSAIKGGLINFSRYLASYYGDKNIRINCVSPGGVFDNQNPTFVANFNAKVPLKRMATPEDIAPSVSFLLSDEAKYITGHNLIVDGGWTAI